MNDVQNIYGLDGQEQSDNRYLKKTGDTATGEIIFDAGIQVNNGLTEINGPAEFNDQVLFNVGSTLIIDGAIEIAGPSFLVNSNLTEFNGATTEFNGSTTEFNSNVDFTNTSSVEFEGSTTFLGGGSQLLNVTRNSQFSWPMTIQNTSLNVTGASTVNFGSGSATNNTPVFNTYKSQVNIGDGGQGSVNVETAVNLGGFASLNLVNADINMADDSIINQYGTRTIPNNMYSMNMIAGSQITFPDTTTQNSAYTGAGALAGTYTASDITLDSNGRITAISSSAAPTSLTLNNLNIPIGGLNILSPGLGGIQNPVNNGGKAYISGTTITAAANWVPAGVASRGFLICFSDTLSTNSIPLVTVRITFSYVVFNNSSGNPVPFQWGKCYFDMDLYPGSFNSANVTAYPMNQYNVSNYISGNNAFNQTSALIPNGRPYWCYNQNYVNPSTLGPIYGYIAPIATTPISAVIPNRWAVFPTMYTTLNPAVATYAYEGSIEVLNCQAANAVLIGVGVSSINA